MSRAAASLAAPAREGVGTAAPLLAELRDALGAAHVLKGADAEGHLTDQHRRLTGRALAVVRPADTAQVAQVVRLARRHRTPIVPQGGNTGLMGAATPDGSGRAIVLSLARLNRVRAVDTDNDTLTVEAGAVLAAVQQAAREAGRLFPLSLGSEGSCTIGGNLATNAGGTQVLRYGNARELVLGLEVVTAEGEVWNGLRGLRKDNTGYALRDLYVGSEGTLGIITAATLKLYPLPQSQHTALLAFGCIHDAVAFLGAARAGFGAGLTAFELISDTALGLIAQHVPEQPIPLDLGAPWYALIELSDSEGEAHARERFESVVGQAFEDGLVADAAIAESLAQSEALWRLRDEALGEAQKRDGRNVKHDVSVPISRIPDFLAATAAALQERFPGVRPVAFGHLGDGNLHYNVSHPAGGSPADVFAVEDAIHETVHDSAHAHGGSISAEHGIGQTKRDLLPRYKSAVELDLMRRLKAAFDPLGLLNPGKVLPPAASPLRLHFDEIPAP
ncbi:FAD-binding oxidoreductase [Paracidovorax cattleyae]|uniref:FAD/FMN-containing dehydrogenase n=1 Tax=Paracidovorax cattleyae TaxID=80868 RepID=A0A1H0R4H2_9BURK|nr:FAD-binding oxidoreductase [Paracidovorax cattleyae]AVS74775.1 FAD-binding oxidoreductase [Paracidovorax cattleyae]SDP23858.1 FAD/FMN-containing dehydrogenase [Paracidovorax cattleyae]